MVFRLPSRLPPEAMRTFEIKRPLTTHWRKATCAEMECATSAAGWTTTCDLTTELGLRQARYIRDESLRRFTHTFSADGKLLTFAFPGGQECFTQHRLPVLREPLYVVRNGDHRGAGRRPAERRTFDRADHWVSDFAEHQDRLAELQRRG